MFKIDLLKGEDIPGKGRPEGVAIAVGTFTVPIIVAATMFGLYLNNSIAMSIQKRDTVKYAKKTDALSEAVKLRESLEEERTSLNNSLWEVVSSINRHTQWSPVLATLVKYIPDSMVLTNLEVEQEIKSKKVPSKDDPKKMTDVSVPARTLQMNICGSSQSYCDMAVKDFKDRLWKSTVLGPRLEDIRISQESDMIDKHPVVCYQIDFVFKPGL
ncbi:MAG: hypothetical protein ACYTEW_26635 [Planctomycetota bacterium]|jgi:hypothetical protein